MSTKMSSTKMSSIKERLNAVQLRIDETDTTMREHQTQIEEQEQRLEHFEEQTKIVNNQIRVAEDIQCEKESEMARLKSKILEIETESEENGRFARVLTMREQKNIERIQDLEQTIEQRTAEIERLDRINSDLQSKCQQAEDKLDSAECRGAQLKCMLDEGMEEVSQLRYNFKSKEACKKEMEEKFNKWEYECHHKQESLDETSCRAEQAETKLAHLRTKLDEFEDELVVVKEKRKACENEMFALCSEVEQM